MAVDGDVAVLAAPVPEPVVKLVAAPGPDDDAISRDSYSVWVALPLNFTL
jgi:hypothetical protein